MNRNRIFLYLMILVWTTGAGALEVDPGRFQAVFERGGLVSLTDASGAEFVAPGSRVPAAAIRTLDGDRTPETEEVLAEWDTKQGARTRCAGFAEDAGAELLTAYAPDETGGLIITQEARATGGGVWGVEWSIGAIPIGMNIIVPAQSGLRLTKETPGSRHELDYPMSWEAQLVIVEGEGRGFYVWAEDAEGRFKRLTIDRRPDGWNLAFATINFAPFAGQKEAESVRWRLDVYEGDWRIPARRYRDWADSAWTPEPIAAQTPAWVKDIRCCVIMTTDPALLQPLAERLDPAQTLLYIPHWRRDGYDRNYPDYTAADTLDPFLEAARALGFRIMLHVNYFGCHPEHPAYAQFEPYQVREPRGENERMWWTWDRVDPPIKFAYINPAHKPWRDYFVNAMAELCANHAVDALHLDQTLCIFNDHQGLVEGMSMFGGSVALHRELRAALPEVALSGEGLNEITSPHEAFAQRHVWGLYHHLNRFDYARLRAAHPISSYLFVPYTTLYGYLGMHPPTDGQLYSAWREAYRHHGVIPTLAWPNARMLEEPAGFARQFFDEATFWLDRRPNPDLDRAAWPADVAFPYITDRRVPVEWRADRSLVSRRLIVSRTVKDRTWYRGEGAIPGWPVYEEGLMRALDPGRWYPLFDGAPGLEELHLVNLPPGLTMDVAARHEGLAVFRTRLAEDATIDLANYIESAVCGTRPASEEVEGAESLGALLASDGGLFFPVGSDLHAHPPWRGVRGGQAYARFKLVLPWNARRFISDVALDPEAAGKSDGVRFQAIVTRNDVRDSRGVFTTDATHRALGVGLRNLAGKEVTLELIVDAGPDNDPTHDWARWYNPRIENDLGKAGEVTLAGVEGWAFALAGDKVLRVPPGVNEWSIEAVMPGAVYLLDRLPPPAAHPIALDQQPFFTTLTEGSGVPHTAPGHASAVAREVSAGGVARPGLFVHPPNRGRTIVDIPVTLPVGSNVLHTFVGLADGSKSEGIRCSVEANGVEIAAMGVEPGPWLELEADLDPWSGKPTVISLITDASGGNQHDWGVWGEPVIRAAAPEETAPAE